MSSFDRLTDAQPAPNRPQPGEQVFIALDAMTDEDWLLAIHQSTPSSARPSLFSQTPDPNSFPTP